VKLIEDLWGNGISAELAVDSSSIEELIAKYKDNNHRWIVIAKQDSKERGFKVRNLVRKEEFDIRNTELVPWLRSEVQARHQREGGNADARQARPPGQQDPFLTNERERANDVRILVPQHRSKKTNRRNIVESGMIPVNVMCFPLLTLNQPSSAHARSPKTQRTPQSSLLTRATTSSTPFVTPASLILTAGAPLSKMHL
jgi:hypothetical protein